MDATDKVSESEKKVKVKDIQDYLNNLENPEEKKVIEKMLHEIQ